jgi:hypothetical protein
MILIASIFGLTKSYILETAELGKSNFVQFLRKISHESLIRGRGLCLSSFKDFFTI